MMNRPWHLVPSMLCLLALAPAAWAQNVVTQFADLNTGPNPEAQGGMGAAAVFFDNRTFFVAATNETGAELWVTDGSALNTRPFADLCPGRCSSSPQSFYIEGGDLYFAADDGVRGSELWRLSPGAAAPVFLFDINPGPASSVPARFERITFRINTTVVSRTFFSATRAAEGRELWRLTVGTAPTVALERDILPGPQSSEPLGFAILNTLQTGLTARTANSIREVLALDYTSTTAPASGQTAFTAFTTNGQRRAQDELQTLGPNTYLVIRDSTNSNAELWVMQGTNASAIKLRTAGSIGAVTFNVALFRTFFSARTGSSHQLFVTDGSVGGTTALGSTALDPANLHSLGNRLVFTGLTPSSGRELFISDGTGAGTVLLKELVPGTGGIDGGSSGARSAISANNQRYLLGFADQLWISDGSNAGTIEVSGSAIQGTGRILGVFPTTGVESLLSFAAGTASGGEPFYNRGTAASTVGLGNLLSDVGDAFAAPVAVFNQRLIFTGFVPGQTASVMSLPLTGGGAREDLGDFTNAESGVHFGRLWFRGSGGIVTTDATSAGTSTITAVRPEIRGPECVIERNGAAYFIGSPPSNSTDVEIYRSDGTQAGTVPVTDLSTTTDRNVQDFCFTGFRALAAFGNRMMFSGSQAAVGFELFTLDAADQTSLVADIRGGPSSSGSSNIVALADRVVFDADDGVFGREIWVSTGTGQGTQRLLDINPGAASSGPGDITREGNRAFFTATDGASGRELYITDGTVSGTRRVADLFAGPADAFGDYPPAIAAAPGKVYFRATSSAEPACRLFESDGTAAGTRCAYNSASLALGPVQQFRVADNGAVVFTAARASDGEELRVLVNGALANVSGGDIAPGPSGSAPQGLKIAGNTVYFRANDGASGSELWQLSLGDINTVFSNGFE